MLKVAQHFKPHVWMNAHSGMEALFMPCAHPRTLEGHPFRAARDLKAARNFQFHTVAAHVSCACACGSPASRH